MPSPIIDDCKNSNKYNDSYLDTMNIILIVIIIYLIYMLCNKTTDYFSSSNGSIYDQQYIGDYPSQSAYSGTNGYGFYNLKPDGMRNMSELDNMNHIV
jgi:hypothetical protein